MPIDYTESPAELVCSQHSSANLDPLAEHSLFQKITAKRGKQTLLYITHRYSTVRHGKSDNDPVCVRPTE